MPFNDRVVDKVRRARNISPSGSDLRRVSSCLIVLISVCVYPCLICVASPPRAYGVLVGLFFFLNLTTLGIREELSQRPPLQFFESLISGAQSIQQEQTTSCVHNKSEYDRAETTHSTPPWNRSPCAYLC